MGKKSKKTETEVLATGMSANDAPDLSLPPWPEKFSKAVVQVGCGRHDRAAARRERYGQEIKKG